MLMSRHRDTWEPKRNLAGWQPSYDEDLAKIAADKPPGFSLAGLHAEAKRLNEQWRKAKKKSAAVPAKKSTKQAGASTSTKASAKDDKGKKAKGEKKEKVRAAASHSSATIAITDTALNVWVCRRRSLGRRKMARNPTRPPSPAWEGGRPRTLRPRPATVLASHARCGGPLSARVWTRLP